MGRKLDMKSKKMYAALALLLVGSLVGCGQGKNASKEASKVQETQISPSSTADVSGEETAKPSDEIKTEADDATVAPQEGEISGELELDEPIEKVDIDLSQYAESYKKKLEEIQSQYNEYCTYALSDIDGNGIQELVTIEGTCDADDVLHIYSYDPEQATVFEVNLVVGDQIGNAMLYKDEAYHGIVAVQGKQGYEVVKSIEICGDSMSVNQICEGEVKEGEDYYSEGTPITMTTINDYSILGL